MRHGTGRAEIKFLQTRLRRARGTNSVFRTPAFTMPAWMMEGELIWYILFP